MKVKDIFDTRSRVAVILNFRKFVDSEKKTYYLEYLPCFDDGKDRLLGSVHAAGMNRKRLEEACRCFQDAVSENKAPLMKLYAYLGMIVCYYVLGDLAAITRVVKGKVEKLSAGNSFFSSEFFSRINPKGVGLNILKGLGVAAGGALSTVPQTRTAGYALTQYALRMQTEDALLPACNNDFYFNQLKQSITGLEYWKLYRELE